MALSANGRKADGRHRKSSSRNNSGIVTRVATCDDAGAVLGLDPVAATDGKRRRRLSGDVGAARCFVAENAGGIAGYAVLGHDFFDQGFVHLLYVDPVHRRQGIASALIAEVERRCAADKVFTSTNKSNAPMRLLMRRLGYRQVGIIKGLDEGDPEVFYMKRLKI